MLVYVYPLEESASTMAKSFYKYLTANVHSTRDPQTACIFVALHEGDDKGTALKSLEFWRGDGRNHLIFDLSAGKLAPDSHGRAMLLSDSFSTRTYRRDFDLVASLGVADFDAHAWKTYAQLLPLTRKVQNIFFMSYITLHRYSSFQHFLSFSGDLSTIEKEKGEGNARRKMLIDGLKNVSEAARKTGDSFELQFSCASGAQNLPDSIDKLCGTAAERGKYSL